MIKNMLLPFFSVLPEAFLLLGTFALMLYGVIVKENPARILHLSTKAILFLTLLLCVVVPSDAASLFNGHYTVTGATQLAKSIVIGLVFILCFMITPHYEREEMQAFEAPLLILFGLLGMMCLISSSDFMTMFLSIEILSLSLYILVSFQRNRLQSSEAGLKYFILGALSTAILLYGISLMYGYCGTTDFEGVARALAAEEGSVYFGVWIGFVFILSSFAFKLSLAPFHMWIPDIYEGSPTPITAFLASAPKFAAIFILMRLMKEIFEPLLPSSELIIVGLSVLSMLLGAFAALYQKNIKRLLAYSTISHMGYALLAFLNLSEYGEAAATFYVLLYGVTLLGAFACLLNLRRHGRLIEEIRDLSGLAKENRLVACCFAVLLLSLAGIPPLAGFFAKFVVFKVAIDAGFYKTVIVGVIASVISAAYYMKIIKVMFFDALLSEGGAGRLDRLMPWQTVWVMVGVSIFVLTYAFYPDFLQSMILLTFSE
jgi:NADH-quinone oxidoreductase subunit N